MSYKDAVRHAAGMQAAQFERYRSLYPDLMERLQQIAATDAPYVVGRLRALEAAVAKRNAGCEAWLKDRYGLTAAETRVVLHLARGGTVASYAEEAGVGVGTVRSHLKAAFSKTGARRQAELVAVVMRYLSTAR